MKLKYLNQVSDYKNTVLHAIPQGVWYRLSTLTTETATNANVLLSKIYPGHTSAIKKARLIDENKVIPTLREILSKSRKDEGINENIFTMLENKKLDEVSIFSSNKESSIDSDNFRKNVSNLSLSEPRNTCLCVR